MELSPEEQAKQVAYRDARFTGQYDGIWQTVGKCVLCEPNPKYIVFEEAGVFMTVNLYATIDGHMLIVPRRHVRSPKDLTEQEWATIRKLLYLSKRLIKEVHGIKGMQVIQKDGLNAQSTITDHIHFQAVPFDAPDLCVWNYRKLKYTPVENAELFRGASKKLAKYDQRYEEKYRHISRLPILVDLIIINDRHEVLFQERPDWAKLNPDVITVPGGGVENYTVSLETELAREVREETGYALDPAAVRLVDSRIEVIHGRDHKVYPGGSKRVLWNTYVLDGFDSHTPLTPGDDAKSFVWVPLTEVPHHPSISKEMKAAIAKATGARAAK